MVHRVLIVSQVDPLPASQLDQQLLQRWRELLRPAELQPHAELESPFLRPEWFQMCAGIQPGVEIAVLRDAQRVLGFFPYQRQGRRGLPVADVLSDLEAPLVEPNAYWSPRETLRRCGLTTYRFRNFFQPPPALQTASWRMSDFFFIDLSQGFESYSDSRRGVKRHKIRREIGRLRRRAEGQFGEVSLQWVTRDQAVLQTLLSWKSRQAARQGWRDTFSQTWVKTLLWELLGGPTAELSATMAVLRFGNELAAIEYYLRSGNRLHAWLRAYDERHARFGPGHVLFWDAAREAADQGVTRIDWGVGEEAFKSRFATGAVPVYSGWLDPWRMRGAVRHLAYRTVQRCGLSGLASGFRRTVPPPTEESIS